MKALASKILVSLAIGLVEHIIGLIRAAGREREARRLDEAVADVRLQIASADHQLGDLGRREQEVTYEEQRAHAALDALSDADVLRRD